jgi:branched-chain amino acid transport system ATP-binding protein
MTDPTALHIRNVSVQFGGVTALDDVSIAISTVGVHGIIGPNGSGKTTLLNGISGFVPVRGKILIEGREITRMSPYRRVSRGLGRSFQNPRADLTLTVRDVLRLGEHHRGLQPWWKVVFAPLAADSEWKQASARAGDLLERLGLDATILDKGLLELSAGVLKLVDVGRAILGRPKVLILDEPTSGMNEEEIVRLSDVLAALASDGVTVVVVEHNLQFVSRICQTVTVLAGGRVVARGGLDEVLAHPEVMAAYLGATSPEAPTAGLGGQPGSQDVETAGRG